MDAAEYQFPEELRKEFGGLDISGAYERLNEKYGSGGDISWEEYQEYGTMLFDAAAANLRDTVIPEWVVEQEPEVGPVPHLERMAVGPFLKNYSGSSVKMETVPANCSTEIWLNSDGMIVFEDSDSESWCILDIRRMMPVLERARRNFDDLMDQHVAHGGMRVEPEINTYDNDD